MSGFKKFPTERLQVSKDALYLLHYLEFKLFPSNSIFFQ